MAQTQVHIEALTVRGVRIEPQSTCKGVLVATNMGGKASGVAAERNDVFWLTVTIPLDSEEAHAIMHAQETARE